MISSVDLKRVAAVVLIDGTRFAGIATCEGINFNEGIPSDYAVSFRDNSKPCLIIPRQSVLWFEER